MRLSRALLVTALLVTSVAVQTVVLSRIGLPGATPDLVLLVIIGLALYHGPLTGMLVGFAGGLMLDLVPPADGAAGRWAFIYCLVGLAAGRAADAAERSAFLPLVIVATLAGLSVLAYAATGALIGDPRVTWENVVRTLPFAVLYDLLLTPFVVPAVMGLARRVEPRSSLLHR